MLSTLSITHHTLDKHNMTTCTVNWLRLGQPVTIDKLSFTFDISSEHEPMFMDRLRKVAAEYGETVHNPEPPKLKNYRTSLRIREFANLYIQCDPCGKLGPTETKPGARWLRVELNPSKITDFAKLKCFLKALLGGYYRHLYQDAVVTRIDFNVDYYTNIVNDFFIDTEHYAKSGTVKTIGHEYDRGLVGTIYLGANKSKTRLRIYNKTAEIREKSRASAATRAKRGYTDCPADKTLVRMEALFFPNATFAEFSNFSNNIFRHITAYSMPDHDDLLPFFLAYAKKHSLHVAFDLLNKTNPEQVAQIKRLIKKYEYQIDLEDMGNGMIAAWANFIDTMTTDD